MLETFMNPPTNTSTLQFTHRFFFITGSAMKRLAIPFAFLAFTVATIAEPLAQKYAAEIVQQSINVADSDLEFSEWQQSVSGGYILRFDYDVDGDGAAEKFYASSFNADKLVCEWTAYAGSTGKLLGKGALLRPDGFWWNPSTSELMDYVRLGAEGGSAILTQCSKNGLKIRNEPVAFEEVSIGLERQKSPRQGFQMIKPKVFISLLADVVANPAVAWRPLILDDAGLNYSLPNGRLMLTEDAPRMEQLRKFTPTQALAILSKSKALSPNVEPKSTTLRNVIFSVIAILLGLLWFVFKKRK